MAFLLDAFQETVGSIKQWMRPTNAVALPVNWLIADGSMVVDVDSPFNGMPLPNLCGPGTGGKFVRGHPTLTNTNFSADLNYHAAGTIPVGGNANGLLNLQHNHPGGSHTHNISGHTHSITSETGHNHSGPNHSHSFTMPTHSHDLANHTHNTTVQTDYQNGQGGGPGQHTSSELVYGGSPAQAIGLPRLFGSPGNASNLWDHNHAINANSGGPSNNTSGGPNNTAGSTNNGGTNLTSIDGAHAHTGLTGGGTGSTGIASGNTDNALSSAQDITPPWTGLLIIIKVK